MVNSVMAGYAEALARRRRPLGGDGDRRFAPIESLSARDEPWLHFLSANMRQIEPPPRRKPENGATNAES